MRNVAGAFEIVEVLSESRLRDANLREQVYWRRDGTSLAPGYYVVNWPAGSGGRRFGEDSIFHGPFARQPSAVAALERLSAAIAAGCIDAATSREPVDTLDIDGESTTMRRPT